MYVKIENRLPQAVSDYLMATIIGVGLFYGVVDVARQTLSVNGLSYVNVTNVIRSS